MLSRLAVTIASAAMVVCLAAPARAQAPDQIQPFVDCIEFTPSPMLVRAYFGYVSTYSTEVTLQVGIDNYFSPGILNRGQPTVFEPGFHDRVFSTEWEVSGAYVQIAWNLQQTQTALARWDSAQLCGARSRGEWDASAVYAVGDLVRYNGALSVLYIAEGWNCPSTPDNWYCWFSYSPSPPVISDIPDLTTYENFPIKGIPFKLSDANNIWNLTVLADSSDETLVPLGNIIFAGYGAERMLSVFPAPNRKGTSLITLYVSDGFSVAIESFTVIVQPPPSTGVDPGGQE